MVNHTSKLFKVVDDTTTQADWIQYGRYGTEELRWLDMDMAGLSEHGFTEHGVTDVKPEPVKLNLYRLTQIDNTVYSYFDSMVVCAPDEHTAVRIHPVAVWDSENDKYVSLEYRENDGWYNQFRGFDPLRLRNIDWATTHESVICTLIGSASEGTEQGVVLSSYKSRW